MVKMTISRIKQELLQRGVKEITKEDINNWAIALLLEELIESKTN